MGFSLTNHPAIDWGSPIYGNPHMYGNESPHHIGLPGSATSFKLQCVCRKHLFSWGCPLGNFPLMYWDNPFFKWRLTRRVQAKQQREFHPQNGIFSGGFHQVMGAPHGIIPFSMGIFHEINQPAARGIPRISMEPPGAIHRENHQNGPSWNFATGAGDQWSSPTNRNKNNTWMMIGV